MTKQVSGPTPLRALGVFVCLGCVALGLLALKIGEVPLLGDGRYTVFAQFTSASGVRRGAHVELAGVRVGQVASIELDRETYHARVALRIDVGVEIQDDTIASIRTAGIIGDKFVKLSPGGSDTLLTQGMEIFETEASVNLEELLSKYIFESDKP
jgi:phospholipid/cholesterol/gamma-HCH transport system substrate-binding protein